MAIRYLAKKPNVRRELLKLASAEPIRPLTYGKLAERVSIPARGPWKGLLDLIAHEETIAGRPDITLLVVLKRTGYPGQINGESARPPSTHQKKYVEAEWKKIADHYAS